MFNAVIFDLDGTLVDTFPGILESLNVTLQSLNRPHVDMGAVHKMVGRGVDSLILQAVGPEQAEEGKRLFKESYYQKHQEGSTLLPYVFNTLEAMDQKGIKMSVASNKPSDYSLNILAHLGLDRFIRFCFGPDSGIPTKPDPAMLFASMNLMNVTPWETLYVGDMPMDVQTGHNAHVLVALVPTGGYSFLELETARADYLLPTFADLIDIL
jgi:phosphoglycolate phosphatase